MSKYIFTSVVSVHSTMHIPKNVYHIHYLRPSPFNASNPSTPVHPESSYPSHPFLPYNADDLPFSHTFMLPNQQSLIQRQIIRDPTINYSNNNPCPLLPSQRKLPRNRIIKSLQLFQRGKR